MRIETFRGLDILPYLEPLAALRTEIFRNWPYLYEGSDEYEQTYLRRYASSRNAAVVIAFDRFERPVGASTCIPLADEVAAIQEPFRQRGDEPHRFLYFGESVLLPEHRGRGIGHAFFDAREAHARTIAGCDFTCFCSVWRPEPHPARQANLPPLDAFWRRRGYAPAENLSCYLPWLDVGGTEETLKRLDFWIRPLSPRAER